MLIRNATLEDIERIFVIRESVRENHLSREALAKLNITPASIELAMIGGDYILPVAVQDKIIVGFAMAQISEGYVFALFVSPEHEGQGIGRALMQVIETDLAKNGVKDAWLATGAEEGFRAPGFYRHLGWKDAGLMEDGHIKFCKSL